MDIPENTAVAYRTNACYSGCSMVGIVNVASYSLTVVKRLNLTTVTVNNEEGYAAPCNMLNHTHCMGHICQTKDGKYLYPGAMCTVTGNIRDEIYELSAAVISNTIKYTEYLASLESLMLSKSGILRGKCLTGPISGSLRMVILPAWDLNENELYVPRYITNSLVVPSRTRDGKNDSVYRYCHIEEGSYAIVVRPPSLSEASVQPMIVKFWDRSALGMFPGNCEEYHADFDGDEMQVYFITGVEATKECKAWSMLTKESFNFEAIKKELGSSFKITTFMNNTTISLDCIREGVKVTPSMKAAKIKQESFTMINQQMDMDLMEFVEASERGIYDIMRQQLNQGVVGKDARAARAGCVDYLCYGDESVLISSDVGYRQQNERIPSHLVSDCYAGFPAALLISRFCKEFQQAYLDSHRAKDDNVVLFDMVSSFIRGSDKVVYLSSVRLDIPGCGEVINSGEKVYVCHQNIDDITSYDNIVASYSYKLLSYIEPSRRRQVARRGILMLIKYYDIVYCDAELNTLVEVILNQCVNSDYSPTTSEGIGERNYRWITKLVAQSWKSIYRYSSELDRIYNVDTRAEACIFGNCAYLPSVLTNVKAGSIGDNLSIDTEYIF